MKTLYISDLDGTLLNSDAYLSDFTTSELNRLIESGMHFTIATARTPATALPILKEIKLTEPIIMMTGVLIYDISTGNYIKKEIPSKDNIDKILSAMKETGQTGLVYALSDNELVTYYERIYNAGLSRFINERTERYNKKFTKIDDFCNINAEIIYFCFMDTFEAINLLYEKIKDIKGICTEKYQDIYSDGDLWYMEIFSEAASKYNAINFIKQHCGYDYIVSFGDNLNDIPMFKASNESYAVKNAKPEVKENAFGFIDSNVNDGVVKYLINKWGSL